MPPAGCAARGSASTRSVRPATRAMPPSPRRCARPIRRCCTTAPAASTWLARRPSGRVGWPVPVTCWRACWPWPRSRSPVDATRCSATPSSTSSRRRRRSPRTCRGPSASRSPSTAPAGSTSPLGGRPIRSRSARSATRASTTPPRKGRSTPRGTPLTTVSVCRCCSCARTTGGASACHHPLVGWRRRWPIDRASGTRPPTAATSPTPTTPPASSPSGCGPSAGRRSYTCARFASWVTRAPMSRAAIAALCRCGPTSPAIRCSGLPDSSSPPVWRRRPNWSSATSSVGARSGPSRSRCRRGGRSRPPPR